MCGERGRDVHSLFGHMVCCISLLMVSAACYLSKLSAVLSIRIMLPGAALMGSLHATDLFKMKEVMAGMDSVINCVVDSTSCFIWFQTAIEVGVIAVVLPCHYSPVCNVKL